MQNIISRFTCSTKLETLAPIVRLGNINATKPLPAPQRQPMQVAVYMAEAAPGYQWVIINGVATMREVC